MTMKTNLKTLSTPWLPLLSGLLLATLSLGACGDDQGACEGASCEPSSGDGDGDGGAQGDGDDGIGGSRDADHGDEDPGDESTSGGGGESSEDGTSSGNGDNATDGECPSDTWDHDEDPETKCKAWTTCEAGEWVSEEGTPVSDRACTRCEDGTFSAEDNAEECTIWSECPSGVREVGTGKSDVLCEAAVSDVAAGEGFSCLLREDGTVWCWGKNDAGQLGRGDQLNSVAAQPVLVTSQRGLEPLHDVEQLSVGRNSACATRSDQSVWCWGNNSFGQVSLQKNDFGQPIGLAKKLLNERDYPATQVQVGDTHACAILPLGVVTCWGAAGRLFNHKSEDECWGAAGEQTTCDGVTYIFQYSDPENGVARVTYKDPTDSAKQLGDAVDLTVGGTIACAVRDDGRTTCWRGWYHPGYAFEMNDVTLLTNVTSLSGAGERTCWLKENHDVYCARHIHQQQSMLVDFREVVLPLGLVGVEVEARGDGMCLLSEDGTVWRQTADSNGNLPTSAAVKVAELEDIVTISGRYGHLCALDGAGRVHCGGSNESGELGDNTFSFE